MILAVAQSELSLSNWPQNDKDDSVVDASAAEKATLVVDMFLQATGNILKRPAARVLKRPAGQHADKRATTVAQQSGRQVVVPKSAFITSSSSEE